MIEPHPMQPIVRADDGVIRFKANAILKWAVDTKRLNLNEIAEHNFPEDDRMQLAQLIGYSVSGYGDLSYASEESVAAADAIAEKLTGN